MPKLSDAAWRFVSFEETVVEKFYNKSHHWYCPPGMANTDLLFVRVKIPPGHAHAFHVHPKMEEILYVLSGTAEQWVEREQRGMVAGDSLHLPAGIVHGTYNGGGEVLDFLAILSPASAEGPGTVDVSDQEPWKSLRPETSVRRPIKPSLQPPPFLKTGESGSGGIPPAEASVD